MTTEDQITPTLESLRPQSEGMIMDLVAEAGIDVSPWRVKQDGSAVTNPRANPHYCYEWAFGGNGEPTVLCIWHGSLVIFQGLITCEENLRQHALKLDRLATDHTSPTSVKSRARDQAKRARRFDSLLQRAYRNSEPLRVVVLEGEPRPQAELGWDTSKVKHRSLDPDLWYVHSYSDDDGSFRLVRGMPFGTTPSSAPSESTVPLYVDQFSLPEPVEKRQSVGVVFPRSQSVRQTALLRARGRCECCDQPGFETDTGAVFLETHHVIPLSEGGPDIEWNVMAMCPNDHRRAHFSKDREGFRIQLVGRLVAIYPGAESALRALLDAKPAAQESLS